VLPLPCVLALLCVRTGNLMVPLLLSPNSVSKGLSSLMDPELEIVQQRIDMGGRNIRIMAEVLRRIERR
jgi:hypothetical protein